MSTCKACGGSYRKGSMVMLLVPGQGMQGIRACPKCVGNGITLVAPSSMTPVTGSAKLDEAEKDVRKVLRGLSKHLMGLAKVSRLRDLRLEHLQADAYERAADIAKAWADQPAARKTS